MADVKVYQETYDNVGLMVQTFAKRPNNQVMRNEDSSKSGSKSFTGTKSLEEALDLLEHGWTDRLEEIKKEIAQFSHVVTKEATAQRVRPYNHVVGYVPNVPNAILGLPESMINTTRVPQKVKTVQIVHNMGVNCGIDANDILKAGITTLKLVNILEAKGIRVRFDCICYSGMQGNERAFCKVKLKDWRQPLDLRKVAFPIAHPSFFRRIGFRFLETVPGLEKSGWAFGYGTPLANDGYVKELEELKRCNLFGDNDFLTSTTLCMENDYDVYKVAKAAGITL